MRLVFLNRDGESIYEAEKVYYLNTDEGMQPILDISKINLEDLLIICSDSIRQSNLEVDTFFNIKPSDESTDKTKGTCLDPNDI